MIPKGDEVRGSGSRVTALDDREIHVGLEDFVQVIRPDIEGDMLNDLDDLGVTATRRQAPFLDPTRGGGRLQSRLTDIMRTNCGARTVGCQFRYNFGTTEGEKEWLSDP